MSTLAAFCRGSRAEKKIDEDDSMTMMKVPLLPAAGPEDYAFPRFPLFSFLSGIVMALASQYLLSQTLWNVEASLLTTTTQVVAFSFGWAALTCGFIFLSMLLLIKTTGSTHPDVVFQMEAHFIVGALLTVSVVWMMIDLFQSYGLLVWQKHKVARNVFVSVCLVAWYAAACKWLAAPKQRRANGGGGREHYEASFLLNTYQLIAATLGLLSGLCSQLLLSFALWNKDMTQPVVENVVVFSLLWSVGTVILTFLGCIALKCLTSDQEDVGNLFLRMESQYVFCSLIGICLAWIVIDVVLDMKEQILPSLLMLALSLASFCMILFFLPDKESLTRLHDELQLTEQPKRTVDDDSDEEQQALVPI
jgi:hypothetical protein